MTSGRQILFYDSLECKLSNIWTKTMELQLWQYNANNENLVAHNDSRICSNWMSLLRQIQIYGES